MGGEEVLELFLGGVEGKVSNKQFRTHYAFTFRFTALSEPFPTIGSQIIIERVQLRIYLVLKLASYLFP
jgi:hypothetical protein